MVDLHSHILPGLDDGAATTEESLEMLRLAANSGTTDIVATPHCNSQFPFDPERIAQSISQLSAETRELIAIHAGCDFHLSYDNVRDALENPTKYTVNHGPYLMVELPDFVSLPSTRQVLRQLLNSRITPILTHPERNNSLQKNMNEIKSWVDDGCFIQITAQSLLGFFGASARRAAHALMNRRLVHFIASDAHDVNHRPPDLSPAFNFVKGRYGANRADALFVANPAAVINAAPLPPPPPEQNPISQLLSRFRTSVR